MKPLLFENSNRHLRIPHNTPREIEDNAYTKCLRDKQGVLLEMCKWRMEPTVVPFVRSSCHRGCEREGPDIKRDEWVSWFIICHSGKKFKVVFRTWQLHFLHHPRDTYVRKTKLINLLLWAVYVVVQFYPCFKFYFRLFLGMVMYDNDFETKENRI